MSIDATTTTKIIDRRLQDADRVLSEHYTAAVGGKAQRYEPAISGVTVAPEELILRPQSVRERHAYAAVDGVLASLPTEHRRVARLVYALGTDALSSDVDEHGMPLADRPDGLVTTRSKAPDRYGLLRLALRPTWGRGSLIRLAVTEARAVKAFAKRYPDREPTHYAVLDFLADEAGRGDAAAPLLAAIRDECQETRDRTLRAFSDAYSRAVAAARTRFREERAREIAAAAKRAQRAAEARQWRKPKIDLSELRAEARAMLDALGAA